MLSGCWSSDLTGPDEAQAVGEEDGIGLVELRRLYRALLDVVTERDAAAAIRAWRMTPVRMPWSRAGVMSLRPLSQEDVGDGGAGHPIAGR